MELKGILDRIIAFFSAILLLFGVRLPARDPVIPTGPCTAQISVSFTDDTAGSAAGSITLQADQDGRYTLYWGNEQDEKLTAQAADRTVPYTEFLTVDVQNGEGSAQTPNFLAIPAGAHSILAYGGETLAGTFPLPKEKADAQAYTYSFGTLSDVHFNRYNKSGTGDDAMITFPNALDFFEDFDVSMVAMTGDLSAFGEEDAFRKFHDIAANYDFPVYTCKGNHDCYYKYKLESWQKYINPGVYSAEKAEGVVEVAKNGLDFVYCGERTHGDVFIFFSQVGGLYPALPLVTDAQLDWLEQQLETYKDKRVYLFFHTFLNAPSGNPYMGEGNLMTKTFSHYLLPFTTGTRDEVRFRALLNTYKNVTFFNGHSHWAHYLQSINPNLNITDYDGTTATMVHISSVSSPRISSDTTLLWTSDTMKRSEGYLVTVYADHYVLTACDFLQNQMLAYATYIVEK